jgi:hypothetical protein
MVVNNPLDQRSNTSRTCHNWYLTFYPDINTLFFNFLYINISDVHKAGCRGDGSCDGVPEAAFDRCGRQTP